MKSPSQVPLEVPLDVAMDSSPVSNAPMLLSERVGIARELLVALIDATRAGQRHVMCRVLDILQGDILRPTVQLTQPQVVAVMAVVTELQHEAARAAPDLALFCARARLVIDVLSSM